MLTKSLIGAVALAGVLSLGWSTARAFDETKYPDFKGQWVRVGNPNWRPVAGTPPLTAEYQKVFEANLADMANGGPGDVPSWACIPQGMPMMMNLYDPMEIVVTQDITYILISHVDDSYRRVYTDGRAWPQEGDYELTFAGYSLGKWVDEDNDGKYDVLEVETRHFKGPRAYDASGIPLHRENGSVIKERIFLDKSNKNLINDEITVDDKALTRPWTIVKKAERNPKAKPLWRTETCSEGNSMVRIGSDAYFLSVEGLLMPTRKDQRPPDLRYFKASTQ